ncbi:MAG: phosphodiesterase [Actinobacteria bacterium]|nr:MAG: phosphodiesterase [Actinomycetota bacterium]
MRHTAAEHVRLRQAVERTGYYPELVLDSLRTALGAQDIASFLVHHEATFDGEELRRHITVLVLTESRLIVAHVDEFPAEEGLPARAASSTEAVRIELISSVVVSRTIPDPAHYRPDRPPTEVVITVGWGAVNRIDLEPAHCGDPQCDADHGYTGTSSNDDFTVRISEADGEDSVLQALAFAATLSAVSSH